jgi:LmbE family N-acetylglucosaminyl deacetylase
LEGVFRSKIFSTLEIHLDGLARPGEKQPFSKGDKMMSDDKVSIVFFDAHAGDMINTSAGTIANYAQAGHRVTLVALNPGEKGYAFYEGLEITAEQYRQGKIDMWESAGEILGVSDVRTLKWKDAETPYNDEVTNTCCDIIREVQADIVVTHWKGSFHKDHVNTYKNVMDAVFLAGLPGYERGYPAYRVKHVYFTDNWEDWEDYEPDIYVDITDVIDLKLKALDELLRIKRELGLEGGFDYKGFYRALAKMRGCLSREFEYAEGYATSAYKPTKQVKFLPV